MPRLLAETSSYLFMWQTMLCKDCWQTLPHIFLSVKTCYAKTAGRDFLTSVYVPNHAMPRLLAETSSLLFVPNHAMPRLLAETSSHLLNAKPCYARTAGRHFLTSVYVPNHAIAILLADTSSNLFMCQP